LSETRNRRASGERTGPEASYDILARFANDAIVVVDMERRIVEVNDAAMRLYGYERDEFLSMSLEQLSRDRDDTAIGAHFEQIAAQGEARFETHHVRRDGTAFTVEASARRVEPSEGDLIVLVLRDVTAARAEAEELRSSRDYVEQLIDYASAPIIVWNADGIITRFNFGFERLTGRKSADLVGRPLGTLFPDETRDSFLSLIGQTLEDESRDIVEIPILAADGRQLIVLWNSSNIFAKDGTTLVATIAQGQDITERVEAERVLRKRTEDLARSNAELEQFAYIASHDLQEPLRMIASYTQLLQKRYAGRLDADADDFIGFAVDGATRMQILINDLLAFSRVGTQGGRFQRTSLQEVMKRVERSLAVLISETGGSVCYEGLPEVVCDGGQIERVFQNLVINALKFHGEVPPVVTVSAERGEGEWRLCVADNGIGIEEQYRERVFVIFQRLHARTEYEGTGMGLAICKRIVGRHGGQVWVESVPGAGSTFAFTIPDRKERGNDG
jgi:PAS domain S-box-containing protein